MGPVRGGPVSAPSVLGETAEQVGEVVELLVEEISIDGLCGVY
jgi:mycofactocin precursor